MARRSDNRGFASMEPERRRRIDREGGLSSRGGRRRDYEDEYDEDYEEDYDEDQDWNVSNRYRDDEGEEDLDPCPGKKCAELHEKEEEPHTAAAEDTAGKNSYLLKEVDSRSQPLVFL